MSRVLSGLPLVILLLVATCGAGTVVPAPAPDAVVANGIVLWGSPAHRAVVEEVATIMRGDLGLPLPARVDVHVYESRDAFRDGLVDDAALAPSRVDEIAAFAVGLARPGRVMLQARTLRGRVEWRRLIAHELTHVVQFELAGGEGRSDQWLAEGLAERVAFQVLEHLELDSLANRRARALDRARRHPAFSAGRLDLAALGSPREFTLRHQRDGSLETYQLSFLMADYLVDRDGMDAALAYFRRCREMDRHRAFARTPSVSVSRTSRPKSSATSATSPSS